jgi:hypothetical protein
MPAIKFTAADVVRLLRLKGREDVDALVRSGWLDVSAHTRTGRPLFDVDAVRRVAARVVQEPKP